MRRRIWLVFGVVLAVSLIGCAQQEATEATSEEASVPQEKTADDYVSEGDFSESCPVSGAVGGAIWFDTGYQTKLMDGTIVDSDTLSVESSLTVKATSPKTKWTTNCAVMLLDSSGEYLWGYGGMKNGPTDSTNASFPCGGYSTFVEQYGEAARFEMYVVRVDFADGASWGFSLDDFMDMTNTREGYEAVKKAGKLIGEGSIQRNGNNSGIVERSNSVQGNAKSDTTSVSTDAGDCVGTWRFDISDGGYEDMSFSSLSEPDGKGDIVWTQTTPNITQSIEGYWEWSDLGFTADGVTYHARITARGASLFANVSSDGKQLYLYVNGVGETWNRVS